MNKNINIQSPILKGKNPSGPHHPVWLFVPFSAPPYNTMPKESCFTPCPPSTGSCPRQACTPTTPGPAASALSLARLKGPVPVGPNGPEHFRLPEPCKSPAFQSPTPAALLAHWLSVLSPSAGFSLTSKSQMLSDFLFSPRELFLMISLNLRL